MHLAHLVCCVHDAGAVVQHKKQTDERVRISLAYRKAMLASRNSPRSKRLAAWSRTASYKRTVPSHDDAMSMSPFGAKCTVVMPSLGGSRSSVVVVRCGVAWLTSGGEMIEGEKTSYEEARSRTCWRAAAAAAGKHTIRAGDGFAVGTPTSLRFKGSYRRRRRRLSERRSQYEDVKRGRKMESRPRCSWSRGANKKRRRQRLLLTMLHRL
jgi:hypothetical protein